MKKFKVTICETVSQDFEVEAEDLESAEEIAIKNYDIGEFVLEPGNLCYKEMAITDTETEEQTSWFEF